MQFTRVQLTAVLNGQCTSYMSAHAYMMIDIHESAIHWAMEYRANTLRQSYVKADFIIRQTRSKHFLPPG